MLRIEYGKRLPLFSGSGADCDRQIPRTISHDICVLSLASVHFPMPDQQFGTHYLLIYEQFKKLHLLGDV